MSRPRDLGVLSKGTCLFHFYTPLLTQKQKWSLSAPLVWHGPGRIGILIRRVARTVDFHELNLKRIRPAAERVGRATATNGSLTKMTTKQQNK